jgi:general secretion pathway protein A
MQLQERYCAYWGLAKPPFENTPDLDMYFDLHTSVNTSVSETLYAIEEDNERLIVILGDMGFGKTMTLQVILNSLEQEKYGLAFVSNPDTSFSQLLQEIIGQLSGEVCIESRHEQILDLFNRLIFKIKAEAKKVLIVLDDADTMKPLTLERLKHLTNRPGNEEDRFTLILAGQPELARRLEHPKRPRLFPRIGVYCQLTTFESQQLMRDYIEYRLKHASTSRRIFTDDAYDAIWEYSENGVPQLVNQIARLALKAGQTQLLQTIDAEVVRQIGPHFERVSRAIPTECRKHVRDVSSMVRHRPRAAMRPEETTSWLPPMPSDPPSGANAPARRPERMDHSEEGLASDAATGDQQCRPPLMADLIKCAENMYLKAKELPPDQRLKLGGQLAAEVLKRYPHLIQQLGSTNDPIPAWTILRNVIMRQLDQHLDNGPAANGPDV